MLPVAELDRGFIRPSYPAQVVVSYFQAGRICDFIKEKWGYEKLIAMMGRIVSHSTTNVCSISQRAALAALSNPEAAEVAGHRMVLEYAKRRDFLIPALNALPGVACATPGGALYAFPDVSSHFGKKLGGIELTGSAALAKALLETVAVAVTPGAAFGEDRCIRLSFATSRERLEEGAARMTRAFGAVS